MVLQEELFSKKQLYRLIVPLIIEQVLAVTVGMADVMMVSRVGESAISGVSLVDTLGVLLINIFTALATGGAVVSAQYIGHKEQEKGCKSAKQLLLSSTLLSLLIMTISLVGNELILRLIYGDIDPEIMSNARKYFYITAISYPFLAIYNSCAALFRAMGNSKVSMKVSVVMNIINVSGNALFLIIFHMGVVGVGTATLLSRIVAAIIILRLIQNKKNPIHIDTLLSWQFDFDMIRRILRIGIPNGLENSMFQIGKVMVQGLIASFGLSAIAANSVAGTLAGLETIPGAAIGLSMITVVGQCVGANDIAQAKKYAIKLIKLSYMIMFALNFCVVLFRNQIVGLFALSPETAELALLLMTYHSVLAATIWTPSFTLPNALRAANDVKFTMVTSVISMWMFRIVFSYILGKYFGLGVFGVWIAMTIDWFFRGTCFTIRFLRGKWKQNAYLQ